MGCGLCSGSASLIILGVLRSCLDTDTARRGGERSRRGPRDCCPPRQERLHCVCLLGMMPSQPTLSCPTCPPLVSPSRTWHPSPWSSASSAPEGPTLPWAPKDLSGGKDLRGGPSQLPCVIEKETEAWRRGHRPRQYGKWGFAGDPVLVSESLVSRVNVLCDPNPDRPWGILTVKDFIVSRI